MAIVVVLYLAVLIIVIAAGWKLYEKAGQPGWASIIPIYGTLVMLKIIGKPWWWLLMFLIPVVNIVFAIWMINMLSKSFGKDVGYTLGLIFLSPIFYPMLAFGSATYKGPYGDQAAFQAAQNPQFDFEQNKQ